MREAEWIREYPRLVTAPTPAADAPGSEPTAASDIEEGQVPGIVAPRPVPDPLDQRVTHARQGHAWALFADAVDEQDAYRPTHGPRLVGALLQSRSTATKVGAIWRSDLGSTEPNTERCLLRAQAPRPREQLHPGVARGEHQW